MTDPDRKNNWTPWHIVLLPIRIVFAVVILVSEVIRPIYRPLVKWISSLPVIEHFSDFIGGLPRLAILILFAVPFAIAEPLKIVGVIVISRGSLFPGIAIIVGAYLMSFVLVERIYHAGREKLLSYAWLRWVMERVDAVRSVISRIRQQVLSTVGSWFKPRSRR